MMNVQYIFYLSLLYRSYHPEPTKSHLDIPKDFAPEQEHGSRCSRVLRQRSRSPYCGTIATTHGTENTMGITINGTNIILKQGNIVEHVVMYFICFYCPFRCRKLYFLNILFYKIQWVLLNLNCEMLIKLDRKIVSCLLLNDC